MRQRTYWSPPGFPWCYQQYSQSTYVCRYASSLWRWPFPSWLLHSAGVQYPNLMQFDALHLSHDRYHCWCRRQGHGLEILNRDLLMRVLVLVNNQAVGVDMLGSAEVIGCLSHDRVHDDAFDVLNIHGALVEHNMQYRTRIIRTRETKQRCEQRRLEVGCQSVPEQRGSSTRRRMERRRAWTRLV